MEWGIIISDKMEFSGIISRGSVVADVCILVDAIIVDVSIPKLV